MDQEEVLQEMIGGKNDGKALNVLEVYISWTSIEIQDTNSYRRWKIIATNRSMT